MKKAIVAAVCAASSLFAGTPVLAKDITLPAETIMWRESPLPGYQKVLQQCMTCHSAHYAEYQPTTSTRGFWEAQVKRMKAVFNAPIPDEDIPLITDYLVKTYSVERTKTAPKPAAADTAAMPAAKDVNALLQGNACLSCHAIDKKVVGPAYQQVAAKYRDDKDALSKVMASIQKGGSGRWGTVPMPPYAALSQEELGALAKFVLQQK